MVTSCGVTVNSANPQAVAVIALIFATGLIVTVNTKGVPVLHNNVLGVIVYVAYCVELVELVIAALVILSAAVPL